MPLRDLPYASTRVVYVLDGLRAAPPGAYADALRAWLDGDGRTELGRRWARLLADPRRRESAIDEAVMLLEGDLGMRDLAAFAVRLGFGALPTRILLSGDRVAVSVDHRAMDGGRILNYAGFVVSTALGDAAQWDRRPPVRSPLLRGLRRAGRAGVAAFLRRRAAREPGEALAVVDVRREGGPALVTATLPDEVLDALAAADPAAAATPSSRIVSLALEALRDAHTGGPDVPVTIPIDLRRYVGNGRVLGNFMGMSGFATLRGGDWSAEGVTRLLQSQVESGAAMASAAYTLLRWLAHRPRDLLRARRPSWIREASVFVPILSSRRAFPDAVWRGSSGRRIAVVSTEHGTSATTVLAVLALRGRTHVSLWDDSGLFDVARFDARLRAEVERRTGMRVGG